MHAFHQARILSKELIGEKVRYVVLEPETALEYEPGQFFILRLRDPQGEYVERSYSAANFDDSGKIEFVIRIEEMGKMTQLIDKLEDGQMIDIKGPFGRFGYPTLPEDTQKLVLIAGGVGISPLRSMLQKAVMDNSDFPIQLFYGFRNPQDFLFENELAEISKNGRLEVIPSVSQGEDQAWDGLRGYISEALPGKIYTPEDGVNCFICGPPPMVKSTREKLFELGFERKQVHVEAW